MKLIGKIAGKQGKGQTIFELQLMIEDYDNHNSFDRTFLTFSIRLISGGLRAIRY